MMVWATLFQMKSEKSVEVRPQAAKNVISFVRFALLG
jgi:hypothetical protein